MKLNKYIFLLFVLALAVSCTDEDKFNNEVFFELERGGFVRFVEDVNPLIGAETADTWTYNETIEDVNGNLTSYLLFVIADVDAVAGNDTTLVKSYTDLSGPTPMNLTSAELATALNTTTTSFAFGDSFNFIATATRNDGTVFTNAPLVADFDENNFSGNTQENLVDEVGYRSAMNFTLTIACPTEPDVSTYPGTYTIESGVWFDAAQPAVVVAGPEANQITITLQASPTVSSGRVSGTINVVVTINEDQTVSFGSSPGFSHTAFGDTSYEQRAGANFTFECANNQILLRGGMRVAAGTFGSFNTVLTKN